MVRAPKPTHASVKRFIESILPFTENDVKRVYHSPRHPRYSPRSAGVDQIVLSVTPTAGVYALIGHIPTHQYITSLRKPRPPQAICFLHRPFHLDRQDVRYGTLVLSSHTAFDEVLTVGWNTILAERLGVNVQDSLCVQGYKGDPQRRIGILGAVSLPRNDLLSRIKKEFGDFELAHESAADQIRVVAIMNAFSAEEVNRVLHMVSQHGWVGDGEDATGQHVLYLTGQARSSGLEVAKALGMTVACVGHRSAEEWGIRCLAMQLRGAFPSLQVIEVHELEEDEPRIAANGKPR